MFTYSQKIKYPFLFWVPMLILLLVQCKFDPQVPSAPTGKDLTPATEHLGVANGTNVNSILQTGYVAFIMSQLHTVDEDVRYTTTIYTMRGDGEFLTQVIDNDSSNTNPVWSPDGQKIAFDSDRTSNSEIYVVNKDGSNLTRLTQNTADDYLPIWSPDGRKIAFTSNRNNNAEIYGMDSNGNNVKRLTNSPSHDYAASWSPDGEKILFISSRALSTDEPTEMSASSLYVMDKNGENITRLTDERYNALYPAWSPDGRYIAFVHASASFRELNIMILDTETGDITLMANHGMYPTHKDYPMDAVRESRPSWSSRGNFIVFEAFIPHVGLYVYIARIEQGKAVELKEIATDGRQPHWWNP